MRQTCTANFKRIVLLVGFLTLCGSELLRSSDFVRTIILQPRRITSRLSEIGPVATNLWTFDALEVYDPELQSEAFYITSFNSAGHGQLIRLDYRHDRAEAWTLPVGIGSWGIIHGHDGNLYLGSYNGGELLCFNLHSRTWVPLPQAPAAFRKAEFIICDLAQAHDGDIYYGTYPGCHLVVYDPHSGKVTDLGKVADENYLRNIAITAKGIVLCGVGTRFGRVIAYNPNIHQFRTLTPEQYRLAGATAKPLISDHFVVQQAGRTLLVYDANTLKLLRALKITDGSALRVVDPDHLLFQKRNGSLMKVDLRNGLESVYCAEIRDVPRGRWYVTHEGNLLGLRVQSYVFVNVKTHEVVRHRIPVDGLGQGVLWLRSFRDGLIYGGPALGQTMFSYDPQTHELRSYDQVIDQGGEIYYGVPYDGKLYTISYVEATLAVFDPSKAWNQGDTTGSNPRTILRIPEDQYRPVGGIHLGPGGEMYIGTQPNYGLIGGALSVFSPRTDKIAVYRNIIPNEEISALAADSQYVYCGADPGGGGGSKAVATQSHFFVWNPVTRKTVFDQALATRHGLGAIATARGHAYFVLGSNLMDYDTQNRSLNSIYQLDRPRPVPLESLKSAQDGTLWGILGGELAHLNPERRTVQLFPETAGKATSGLTIGSDGTIYFGSATSVWMLQPEKPSLPASFGE